MNSVIYFKKERFFVRAIDFRAGAMTLEWEGKLITFQAKIDDKEYLSRVRNAMQLFTAETEIVADGSFKRDRNEKSVEITKVHEHRDFQEDF